MIVKIAIENGWKFYQTQEIVEIRYIYQQKPYTEVIKSDEWIEIPYIPVGEDKTKTEGRSIILLIIGSARIAVLVNLATQVYLLNDEGKTIEKL